MGGNLGAKIYVAKCELSKYMKISGNSILIINL